jgi:hypothetical protein
MTRDGRLEREPSTLLANRRARRDAIGGRSMFLKKVGVTSQREIEKAVRAAIDQGRLKGDETLRAEVTLTVNGVELSEKIDGRIELA